MADAEISDLGHSLREEARIQVERERLERIEAEELRYAKKTLYQAFHKMLSQVVRTKEFDNVIICFILLNCLFMAMEERCPLPPVLGP